MIGQSSLSFRVIGGEPAAASTAGCTAGSSGFAGWARSRYCRGLRLLTRFVSNAKSYGAKLEARAVGIALNRRGKRMLRRLFCLW